MITGTLRYTPGTDFVKLFFFGLLTTFMNRLLSLTGLAVLSAVVLHAQQGSVSGELGSSLLSALSKSTHITDFSCEVRNAATVLLQWKADNISEGDYFLVERSRDGSHFETMSAQTVTDTAQRYQISDNSPLGGTDYYRIKYIGTTGTPVYSKSLQVSLAGDFDFKFYPNPVDKLLIVRTSHNINVRVMDPLGSVRLDQDLAPGIQIMNASILERGTYVIRILDRESNVVVSEQLVKN
jgi:hypothetical protein